MCRRHTNEWNAGRNAKTRVLAAVMVTQDQAAYRVQRLETVRPDSPGCFRTLYCFHITERVAEATMWKHGTRYSDDRVKNVVYVCDGVLSVAWSADSTPCTRCGDPVGTKHGHIILTPYPADQQKAMPS